MDFRARPNNDYLLNAKWQELYVLTEHWQSDLEFFKDELSFFQTLFDKYFQYLIAEENIKETKITVALFEAVKAEQTTLNMQVARHLIHISELMKNPFVQNEPQFRAEHIALETRFVEFVKCFRDFKQKLFSIAERSSKVEKNKHQLAP
jgi:hypothetical protein